MKNIAYKDHVIERYLDDEMKEAEKARFEDQVSVDAGLIGAIDFHKEVREALQKHEVIEFKRTLLEVIEEAENKKTPQKTRMLKKYWYGIAASIVLFAALGIITNIQRSRPSPDELFSSYYKAIPVQVYTRSDDIQIDERLHEGLIKYKNGDYKNALEIFITIEDENMIMYVSLLCGICYIETQEYEKALNKFEIILHTKDLEKSIYYRDAEWYASLCYIKMEKEDKAKQLLLAIAESESTYKSKAKLVLKSYK